MVVVMVVVSMALWISGYQTLVGLAPLEVSQDWWRAIRVATFHLPVTTIVAA